jgi:hypothetical protein
LRFRDPLCNAILPRVVEIIVAGRTYGGQVISGLTDRNERTVGGHFFGDVLLECILLVVNIHCEGA